MTYDSNLKPAAYGFLRFKTRAGTRVDWFPATFYNHIADKAYSIRSALLSGDVLSFPMLSFSFHKQEPLKANGKASTPFNSHPLHQGFL